MIRWMAEHKVAANLLMLILLVWGGMSTLNLKQELFPEFELDLIRVSISYPGATPEEVKRQRGNGQEIKTNQSRRVHDSMDGRT